MFSTFNNTVELLLTHGRLIRYNTLTNGGDSYITTNEEREINDGNDH